MNLFHNNYNQLMQDNIDAMANLSAKNWNILKKMFEYMSSYNVSLFVFFASTFWQKLQSIFGECCISKSEKVAKLRLTAILPAA